MYTGIVPHSQVMNLLLFRQEHFGVAEYVMKTIFLLITQMMIMNSILEYQIMINYYLTTITRLIIQNLGYLILLK